MATLNGTINYVQRPTLVETSADQNQQILTWRTKMLGVSAEKIMSFKRLNRTAELGTKEKKSGKQTYVTLKAQKPKSVSFDIELHAALGVDVEAEIDEWIELSKDGKAEKLYVAGGSVGTCTYLLESVKVSEALVQKDEYVQATLSLTFKQASSDAGAKKKKKKKKKKKASSSSGSRSSGSSGSSTKPTITIIGTNAARNASASTRTGRPPGLGITIR